MTDLPAEILDEKEIAFSVWLFLAGRNATKTAQILASEPSELEQWEREPVEISARTIRDWVHRYHWEERAYTVLKDAAPGIHAQVVQETIIASLQSIQHLRDVVEGKVEVSDKVRVDAAKTILDRAGHLAFTRNTDGSLPSAPTKDYESSVAGKGVKELAALLGFETVEDA